MITKPLHTSVSLQCCLSGDFAPLGEDVKEGRCRIDRAITRSGETAGGHDLTLELRVIDRASSQISAHQ
ncbi:hypothetical protein BaRGS_00009946 [Batillaria attramentaria]|uniref:Uncharacterized protein n=1 Tax=Batillaria attramentaria TaxID=370345 RepID=A0ABD0LGY7_9CAEN